MNSGELRKKFLQYFEGKGHKVLPSASLVPAETDPSVLFTTAGMQPLVPYFLGENHPSGKRVASAQKCIRTDDVEEVGDKVHHTFFEMLGNWSFGDYFKKESIQYSYEFLTGNEWLGIPVSKLAISVFEGDGDAPFDQESYDLWLDLGIEKERVAKLPKKENWWGPAGSSGPCGPDTEIFYWSGQDEAPSKFDPNDSRWVEIWNNVFMQFDKTVDGTFTPLKQTNVDTGMGLERTLAVLNGLDDNYKTDLFSLVIAGIEQISHKDYQGNENEFRIIADHIKAAVFAINDGVLPSNKGAGYIVRRLIRRAIVKASQIGVSDNFTTEIAKKIFKIYEGIYFQTVISSAVERSHEISPTSPMARGRNDKEEIILSELEKEETKFRKTLQEGLKILESKKTVSGKDLFDLYQSFGIPSEISLEEIERLKTHLEPDAIGKYEELYREHQELSRTASAGMFKGGLADDNDKTKKLHTAAHLMLAALRKVLGDHVLQKGSNITAERLRFDFSYPEKMTDEQIKQVEDLVNVQIKLDLPVSIVEMSVDEAKQQGAMGVFDSKYGDKVKVYSIGPNGSGEPSGEPFSREICGGPHVTHTGELGLFRIVKEESSSAGVRRIKAVLE